MHHPLLLLATVGALVPGPEPAPSFLDGWTENLRWAIDTSARAIVDADGDVATLAFLGLDVHKVVTVGSRDVATLTLQPYLTRVDDLVPTPPLFDGPDDWELVWRIFNANVKLRQDGALNLRVGHFELPYGLEHTLNTNGTLRDYTHGRNFGLKADWGATLNGELEHLEYEVGVSRGSGNEYDDNGDPGLFSGRVGTPRDADRVVGLSIVDGEVLTPAGVIERRRVGVDGQLYWQSLGLFGELSVGEDGGSSDVTRALGEVNWRNPHETVLAWCQVEVANVDGPGGELNSSTARLGVRWTPAAGWSLSAQASQTLDPADNAQHRSGVLALQARYRF